MCTFFRIFVFVCGKNYVQQPWNQSKTGLILFYFIFCFLNVGIPKGFLFSGHIMPLFVSTNFNWLHVTNIVRWRYHLRPVMYSNPSLLSSSTSPRHSYAILRCYEFLEFGSNFCPCHRLLLCMLCLLFFSQKLLFF